MATEIHSNPVRLLGEGASIKEAADIFQVSTDTLRFYEKVGLISPTHNRRNGYRVYGPDEFSTISIVLELRRMGLSIEHIKDYLGNRTLETSMVLLNTGFYNISKQVEELGRMRTSLIESLQRYAMALSASQEERVHIMHQEERRGLVVSTEEIYYEDIPYAFLKCAREHGFAFSLFHDLTCYEIDVDRLSVEGVYLPNVMFILSDKEPESADYLLPAGLYASCTFKGSFLRSPEIYQRILDYLGEQGYRTIRNPVEYAIINDGETDQFDEYICRLEVAVEPTGDDAR